MIPEHARRLHRLLGPFLAASMANGAAACSSTKETQVTPWLKVRVTEGTFEIPHVIEVPRVSRVLVLRPSGWEEVVAEYGTELIALPSGESVAVGVDVGRMPHGVIVTNSWLLIRPEAEAPAQVPRDSDGGFAGHPSRPVFLKAQLRDEDRRVLLEGIAPNGSRTRLAEFRVARFMAGVHVVAVLKSGAVAVIVEHNLDQGPYQCGLYSVDREGAKQVATWSGECYSRKFQWRSEWGAAEPTIAPIVY